VDVVLKTGEQLRELLAESFDLPDGCAYQAISNGESVMVAVDEPLLMKLWQSMGLAALCDVLSRLISEAQSTPGAPVVYGPQGIERRQSPRLTLIAS
jgi:hypothetical protein